MLAILGLFGLALAGTAFVGLSETEDSADGASDTHEDTELVNEEETSRQAASETMGPDPQQDDDLEDGDLITGTDALDELFGSDGNDSIKGLGGADYIDSEAGDDDVDGGSGDDQLHGGLGDDTLGGGEDDDRLYGHVGDDGMSGGDGDDMLQGGDGDDRISGDDGNDQLLGGHGDDTLIGGAGEDVLQGSRGNDVVDGVTGETTAERDYLNGGLGNDVLIGNDRDVMSGGDGADRFEIAGGRVSIMDIEEDDVLIINHHGDAPFLTTVASETGLTLLADGQPVADLFGLDSFDVSTVQLVAA